MIRQNCLAFVLILPAIISTSCATIAMAGDQRTDASPSAFLVGKDGKSILVNGHDGQHTCVIDTAVDQARLSSDGSALLISTSAYVSSLDLKECNPAEIVHATQVPDELGALADVSLPGQIYIGMVPVSMQPLSYLAVVARLGSTKNLISLPGAYVDAKPTAELQDAAFFYDEQTGPFPLVSKNGRYVAISGSPDCSADSIPGVWDMRSKRKVVTAASFAGDCMKLFSTSGEP